eukprot:365810-Chlamydomonas_euryale.AAC.28
MQSWERPPRKPGYRGCASRAAKMRHDRFNFYANEYTVHTAAPTDDDANACAGGGGAGHHGGGAGGGGCPAHICREFANMVVLREPHARLLSHVRYMIEVVHRRWIGQVRGTQAAPHYAMWPFPSCDKGFVFHTTVSPSAIISFLALDVRY